MHGLKRTHAFPGLTSQKTTEQFAFDVLGYQIGDGNTMVGNRILHVILDDDGALLQFVELFRVENRRPVALIAMRKKELRRSFDSRHPFADEIYFPFPSGAEISNDLITAAQQFTWPEIKGLDPWLLLCRSLRHQSTGATLATPFIKLSFSTQLY